MAQELSDLLVKVKDLKTYLVKIGPTRRVGRIIEVKIQEANYLYEEYQCI